MNNVFLMKYGLTTGVIAFNLTDGELSVLNKNGRVFVKVKLSMFPSVYYKKDIALNREEAVTMFEEMRIKKLQSLDEQVKKYSRLELKIK